MSNKKPQTAVPKLRFPEFRDAQSWEEKELSQLGELVAGLTYSPDDVREDGLLVLRSSNIKNGEILLEDNVYVNPDINGVNLSQPNDILICVRNGSKALIGKNALIPQGMSSCTHGAFMTVFRSKSAKFVFQLFQTSAYQKQVDGDLGATINSINSKHLKRYKFFVPKPKEQQKIADCLSSVDELITAEGQKLEALQDHKKGLMQQLFPAKGETLPNLRFPEFRSAPEWEEKPLGKLSSFIKEKMPIETLSTRNYISTENLLSDYAGIIESSKLPNIASVTAFKKGDILISNIRPYLKKVWLSDIDGGTSNDVVIVRAKNILKKQFLGFMLCNDAFISYVMQGAKGVKMPRGDLAMMKEYPIFYPTLEEQQKIVDCLSSLDALIIAQSQKIEALQDHKIGLMQQLFPTTNEVVG